MTQPLAIDRAANNFDCLRLMAALLVFYSHAFAIFGLKEPLLLPIRTDHGFAAFGSLGVMTFFAISGFLVTGSFYNKKENFKYFFYARILRIYPAYLVTYIVTVFIIGMIASTLPVGLYYQQISYQLGDYFINVLFFKIPPLPEVFTHNPIPNAINGPLWTLTYEVGMYVAIAVILKLQSRFGKHVLWLCTLALGAFCFYLSWQGVSSISLFGLILCFCFLLGSLCYIYRTKIRFNFFVVILGVLLLIPIYDKSYFFQIYALVCTYTVLYLAYFPYRSVRCRLHKYGDYSYGIYIYAWPIQQYFYTLFPTDFLLYLICSFLSTLACGVLSWHYIELPALNVKKRKLKQLQNAENA